MLWFLLQGRSAAAQRQQPTSTSGRDNSAAVSFSNPKRSQQASPRYDAAGRPRPTMPYMKYLDMQYMYDAYEVRWEKHDSVKDTQKAVMQCL